MLPTEAVIVVVPAPTPVASPPGLVMVATAVLPEVQVAVLVTSCELPSANVAVAWN